MTGTIDLDGNVGAIGGLRAEGVGRPPGRRCTTSSCRPRQGAADLADARQIGRRRRGDHPGRDRSTRRSRRWRSSAATRSTPAPASRLPIRHRRATGQPSTLSGVAISFSRPDPSSPAAVADAGFPHVAPRVRPARGPRLPAHGRRRAGPPAGARALPRARAAGARQRRRRPAGRARRRDDRQAARRGDGAHRAGGARGQRRRSASRPRRRRPACCREADEDGPAAAARTPTLEAAAARNDAARRRRGRARDGQAAGPRDGRGGPRLPRAGARRAGPAARPRPPADRPARCTAATAWCRRSSGPASWPSTWWPSSTPLGELDEYVNLSPDHRPGADDGARPRASATSRRSVTTRWRCESRPPPRPRPTPRLPRRPTRRSPPRRTRRSTSPTRPPRPPTIPASRRRRPRRCPRRRCSPSRALPGGRRPRRPTTRPTMPTPADRRRPTSTTMGTAPTTSIARTERRRPKVASTTCSPGYAPDARWSTGSTSTPPASTS